MTRFYIKQKDDPHGPNLAMYVGNLPTALSQRQYEKILIDIIGKGESFFISNFSLMRNEMIGLNCVP